MAAASSASRAPARLELFKFTFYVFFPIAIMLHFGDPDWYDKYVEPLREGYRQEHKIQHPQPHNKEELRASLFRLQKERRARLYNDNNSTPISTSVNSGSLGDPAVASESPSSIMTDLSPMPKERWV